MQKPSARHVQRKAKDKRKRHAITADVAITMLQRTSLPCTQASKTTMRAKPSIIMAMRWSRKQVIVPLCTYCWFGVERVRKSLASVGAMLRGGAPVPMSFDVEALSNSSCAFVHVTETQLWYHTTHLCAWLCMFIQHGECQRSVSGPHRLAALICLHCDCCCNQRHYEEPRSEANGDEVGRRRAAPVSFSHQLSSQTLELAEQLPTFILGRSASIFCSTSSFEGAWRCQYSDMDDTLEDSAVRIRLGDVLRDFDLQVGEFFPEQSLDCSTRHLASMGLHHYSDSEASCRPTGEHNLLVTCAHQQPVTLTAIKVGTGTSRFRDGLLHCLDEGRLQLHLRHQLLVANTANRERECNLVLATLRPRHAVEHIADLCCVFVCQVTHAVEDRVCEVRTP
mmetsp:Transcript_1288/g.3036  ORF Transcript_1288/g.3036 Transcript_1288/m.3036 type:complete len:394 (-) Transcript_1288:1220-2401(-)